MERRRDESGGDTGNGDDGHHGADPSGIRQFLYGDCDLGNWPGPEAEGEGEPWSTFVRAREALARGDTAGARAHWRSITERKDVESRQVLQAWHFLRSVGVPPPADVAPRVLGVIAEVAVNHSHGDGHDVLAAYEDGSVRYLNVAGGCTLIDDGAVEAVVAPARGWLQVGQELAELLDPWDGPLPDLPPDHTRILMLTPAGPRFGQGPNDAIQADEAASAFLGAATAVLVAVVG